MTDYASLLRDHVTLKCRCIDQVFLQDYVPKLQSVGEVCTFLRWVKGLKIPSWPGRRNWRRPSAKSAEPMLNFFLTKKPSDVYLEPAINISSSRSLIASNS